MQRDLTGKLFLVTGATEGIGKAAAKAFAARGAELVLIARNPDKGARIVSELKAQTQNDKISLLIADMSSIAEVKKVAQEFKQKHGRVDVLVNNAGALFQEYQTTADGIEMTFALNHVGYQLLASELMPLLQNARVVSTSSNVHRPGKIDLQTIAKRNGKAGFSAYADSKLANVLFTRELARRLPNANVSAFHPGFVQTGFGHNNGKLMSAFVKLGAALFARTPEKGAETLVWLATTDSTVQSGGYYYDKKLKTPAVAGRDDVLAKALWDLTEKLYA
jgi:NAD(P)-dependent dehydrogenase (short-subunit alcohol dehydrogenase family)